MNTRFKPKFNIKKGDTVVVIAGDDKDLKKPRKVLEVLVDKGRVVVEGVNIITKHTKPSAQNTKGGIVKKEASIQISNISLIDPKTKETTRVGIRVEGDKKVRFSKKSKKNKVKEIDYIYLSPVLFYFYLKNLEKDRGQGYIGHNLSLISPVLFYILS